jgi:hypothetical protein
MGIQKGITSTGRMAMDISKATQGATRAMLATRATTILPLVVLRDLSIGYLLTCSEPVEEFFTGLVNEESAGPAGNGTSLR